MSNHTLPHLVSSAPSRLSDTLEKIIINLTHCMTDARQVDIADNYMASDRLTRNLREAQEQLDTLRNDTRSKRSAMRHRNEKIGSVDDNGNGVDHTINR